MLQVKKTQVDKKDTRRAFLLATLRFSGQVCLASGVSYVTTLITNKKEFTAGAK